MSPSLITAVGIVVEGVGLALAILGINRTWREFASPSERLAAPVVERVIVGRDRIRTTIGALADRVLRRKRPVSIVGGAVHLRLETGQVKVRARANYSPIAKGTPPA